MKRELFLTKMNCLYWSPTFTSMKSLFLRYINRPFSDILQLSSDIIPTSDFEHIWNQSQQGWLHVTPPTWPASSSNAVVFQFPRIANRSALPIEQGWGHHPTWMTSRAAAGGLILLILVGRRLFVCLFVWFFPLCWRHPQARSAGVPPGVSYQWLINNHHSGVSSESEAAIDLTASMLMQLANNYIYVREWMEAIRMHRKNCVFLEQCCLSILTLYLHRIFWLVTAGELMEEILTLELA